MYNSNETAPNFKSPLSPPEIPIAVFCLHCGKHYSSDRMVWERDMWCCPTYRCNGAGFGFDVWALDRSYRDPRDEPNC